MTFTEKLLLSLFFILIIPFFRFITKVILKDMEISFEKKNTKSLSFFYVYERIVKFIIKYVLPIMVIITIISIWIKT